jgi:hypothetical protein
MKTPNDSEYRLDVRGRNGKVEAVKIMERHNGGKFELVKGDFTIEHARHMRLFSKVASSVSKAVAPPFDLGAIVKGVNTPRQKKRVVSKRLGKLGKQTLA